MHKLNFQIQKPRSQKFDILNSKTVGSEPSSQCRKRTPAKVGLTKQEVTIADSTKQLSLHYKRMILIDFAQ